MTSSTWETLLRPLLADPATKIEDGKYLALAAGGGIKLNGIQFQVNGDASVNLDLLELLVLLYKSHADFLSISYDVTRDTYKYRGSNWEYPYLIAAIADFHGLIHDFDRDRYPGSYQDISQRVYRTLRERYPNYTPPEKFYKFPEPWKKYAFNWSIFIFAIYGGLSRDLLGALFLYLLSIPLIYFADWLDINIIRPRPGNPRFAKRYPSFTSHGQNSTPSPTPLQQPPPPTSPVATPLSSSPPGFDLPAWPDPDQTSSTPTTPKQYSEPAPAHPPPPAQAPAPPVEQPSGQRINAPHSNDRARGQSPTPVTAVEPSVDGYSSAGDLNLIPPGPRAELAPHQQAILLEITEVAKLLDSAFNIPIINKSVGLDPLIGIVWGLGNLVSLFPASYIIIRSTALGLPSYKLVRMLRNTLIDTGVGLIPIAGQATDFFIKANIANLNIIHDHFGLPPYKRPR